MSGCLLITPDDEHGASNRIRSKKIESHHDSISLASSTITSVECPRRNKFSLMSSALSESISIAVTVDVLSIFSINWAVFPPGAAQASRILPDLFSSKTSTAS